MRYKCQYIDLIMQKHPNVHQKAAVGFHATSLSYERGRPLYPSAAIDFLAHTFQLTPDSAIMDLGAGTGKFTRLLTERGLNVTAVEPIEGMRAVFADVLPNVPMLDGTAESIPLPDSSVDVIFSAQAFHWFDGLKTLPELARVLKPGGGLGLIWNHKVSPTAWIQALIDLIAPYGTTVPHSDTLEWQVAFNTLPLFTPIEKASFSYTVTYTLETLKHYFRSLSFIGALSDTEQTTLLTQMETILQNYPEVYIQDAYPYPYMTDIFWCYKA